jgi:hypothetical protein
VTLALRFAKLAKPNNSPHPTNCIRRHIVRPPQFPDRLTFSLTLPDFSLLMRRQLVLATHPDAPPLRAFTAFSSPALYQFAFEFSYPRW